MHPHWPPLRSHLDVLLPPARMLLCPRGLELLLPSKPWKRSPTFFQLQDGEEEEKKDAEKDVDEDNGDVTYADLDQTALKSKGTNVVDPGMTNFILRINCKLRNYVSLVLA